MNIFHCITDTLVDFRGGKSLVLWAESDIFGNGFLKKLILGILKHKADPLAKLTAVCMFSVQVFAIDQNLA